MSDSRWSAEQLAAIHDGAELEIAVRRTDGRLRPWTPVWAVVAGRDVYVRTWRMRETGWYGAAVRSGRGRVRVPGLESDVEILRKGADGVDEAYRAKYGDAGARSMTTPEAVTSTLRVRPAS